MSKNYKTVSKSAFVIRAYVKYVAKKNCLRNGKKIFPHASSLNCYAFGLLMRHSGLKKAFVIEEATPRTTFAHPGYAPIRCGFG